MYKTGKLMTAVFVLLIFSAPTRAESEESRAFRKTAEAFSKTQYGRNGIKTLEKTLHIQDLPEPVKHAIPYIQLLVDKKISYKWEF